MKNIIVALLLVLSCQHVVGQNVPDYSTTTPGSTTLVELPPSFPAHTLFNYERTFIPQNFETNANAINENTSAINCLMSTDYYDGSNRKLQAIARMGAGLNGHLVQPVDNSLGQQYIEFLPYTVPGSAGFQFSPYAAQRSFYLGRHPDEEGTSYLLKKYGYGAVDNSREFSNYTPGKATVGQMRGNTLSGGLNAANEIIKWRLDISQYIPVNLGYYDAGQLVKEISITPEGNRVEKFIDKSDRLICMKQYSGTTGSPAVQVSYLVYDELGREVISISPKAYLALQSGTAPVQDIVKHGCNTVEYDSLGRVFKKHIAGRNGYDYIIYDSKGRQVLVQTPNQASADKWAFVQYDKLDRVVRTGIFTNQQHYSLATMQNWLDGNMQSSPWLNNNSSLLYFLGTSAGEGLGLTTATDADVLVENYYDDYTNPAIASRSYENNKFFGRLVNSPTAYMPYDRENLNPYGKLTGRRVKVLKSASSTLTDWLKEVYFYDTYGRVIQVQHNNAFGGWDYLSTQYDYSGRMLRSVAYHHNPTSPDKPFTTVATIYNYANITFLPVSVLQQVDNGNWITLSSNSYNNLNQLVSKRIGEIETQDYQYNLRGQLIGINKDYAENGTPSAGKTFGQSIKFEHGFSAKRYDGNISGIIWKGANNSPQRAYGYSYDKSGRLINADFVEFTHRTSPVNISYWTKQFVDFSVSNMTYDLNGNLQSMDARGSLIGQPADMDKLTYAYSLPYSDQLLSVTDAVTTQFQGPDFKDGNTVGADYGYDNNGNLKKDANKHISSISYNHLDLPDEVEFSTPVSGHIRYVYDALGNKLSEEITGAAGNNVKNYIGPFVYNGQLLDYMLHAEGKARYHENSSGVKVFDYDFFIKDHQGNVRTVVTAQEVQINEYMATHEIASANMERLLFSRIDSVRGAKPLSLNASDQEAAELIGSDPEKRIGTSLLLKVMAGDKFDLSTETYYDEYTAEDDVAAGNNELIESLVNALSGGVTGLEGWEGSAGHDIIGNLFTPEAYMEAYNAMTANSTDPAKPKAYLNYMVFDEEMQLVPEESGVIQVGAGGDWRALGTAGQMTVGRNGYLAIYLSNSSDMKVYFDNLRVRFYKGALLDENHYYPYGLVINSGTTNALERKYLYQGKEFRNELSLNLYDFHARQYDPQIGRFLSLDPEGQFHSGYIGMGNNPVMGADPDGRFWHIVIGAVVGAVVNTATHWNQIAGAGGIQWGKFAEAALIGAAAGGVTAATGGTLMTAVAAGGSTTAAVGAGQLMAASAFSGGAGYTAGAMIQSTGNAIAFGDPMPTPREAAVGMVTSMGISAVGSGIQSWIKGIPWKVPQVADKSTASIAYNSTSPKPQAALDQYLANNAGKTQMSEVVVKAQKPVLKSVGENGGTAVSRIAGPTVGGGAKLENLGKNVERIQNIANKYELEIAVVGSRAGGTATPYSDWDYIITGGTSKARSSALFQLPKNLNAVKDGMGRPGSEILKGVTVNPQLPHIIFKPIH